MAKYENIINETLDFPFDVFVQDNLRQTVTVDEHWHHCFEMLYMIKGTARQIINRRDFQARGGDIILIKSGDVHATYCTPGEDTQIVVIKFLPSLISEAYSLLSKSNYIAAFLNHSNNNTIAHLTREQQLQLSDLLSEISKEFALKQIGYDLSIKGGIYKLISCMVRFGLVSTPDIGIRQYDLSRMEQVLDYMETNYQHNISLKEISKILHLNYSYTSRYFKKITGKSFKEYLDYIRICEADKLILSTDLNLAQIYGKCGFISRQSFHRVYRRVRGCTPLQLHRVKSPG